MWGLSGNSRPGINLGSVKFPKVNKRSAVAKKRKHYGDMGAYSLATKKKRKVSVPHQHQEIHINIAG